MSSHGNRLLREGGIKTLTTVAVALLGLVGSIALTREFSKEALGLFVLILAMVQVGVMIADGGSGLAVTRYIAAASSPVEIWRTALTGLRARLLLTVGTVTLGIALLPWLQQSLFHGSLTHATYFWILGWILVKSLFLQMPAVLRGQRKWVEEGVLLALEAAGIVLVYTSLRPGDHGEAVLPVRLSALYLVLFAASFWWARKRSQTTDAVSRGAADPSPVRMGQLLRFGLPLMMNSSLFLALTWTDRILIGLLRSREELAFYFVAVGLSTTGRLIFAIPERILFSHLAETCRPDSPELPKIHHDISYFFADMALLTLVGGAMAGRLLIPLFYGADYVTSIWPFQLLLAVLLVRVISIPASLLLVVVFERTVENRNALALAFLVNLGLNLLLIPRFGVTGAIVASLTGFLLATCYLWISLWRVAHLRPGGVQVQYILLLSLFWLGISIAERQALLPSWLYWASHAGLSAGLLFLAWHRWRGSLLASIRGGGS